LSVYPLRVPPLRERDRDVLLLSGSFLEENRSRLGLRGLRLAPDAQAALLAHPWPGNVRELEHTIARSALRTIGRHPQRPRILTLAAADFDIGLPAASTVVAPADAPPTGADAATLRDATEAFQRQYIEACLLRHRGNRAAAARELGVDRANLARLVRRLSGPTRIAVETRKG